MLLTWRRPWCEAIAFLFRRLRTGAGLVEIKADGTAQEVYFTKEMRNHHSSSILIGDYLYGYSSGILTAMRFDTGAVA